MGKSLGKCYAERHTRFLSGQRCHGGDEIVEYHLLRSSSSTRAMFQPAGGLYVEVELSARATVARAERNRIEERMMIRRISSVVREYRNEKSKRGKKKRKRRKRRKRGMGD